MNDDYATIFRKRASRFYLVNLAVLLALAALMYAGWRGGWYREAFFTATTLFLLWLFNAGKLLRCPACGARLRSEEGLIRMPESCQACGVKL